MKRPIVTRTERNIQLSAADVKAMAMAKAKVTTDRPMAPLTLDTGPNCAGFRDATGRPFGLAEVSAAFNDLFEPTATPEPLTPADVRQAVEQAVRENRTGLPDATAPWTLHLGPGCVVENTESGNRFAVEAGNAIVLDDNVKLRVLDKAEALIDPVAKARAR